jgi:hypothetical protein
LGPVILIIRRARLQKPTGNNKYFSLLSLSKLTLTHTMMLKYLDCVVSVYRLLPSSNFQFMECKGVDRQRRHC